MPHWQGLSRNPVMKPNEIRVVYDGGCPLCRAFVSRLQPRNPAMRLELINARAALDQRRALADRGIALEEGFAVVACDACRTGDFQAACQSDRD